MRSGTARRVGAGESRARWARFVVNRVFQPIFGSPPAVFAEQNPVFACRLVLAPVGDVSRHGGDLGRVLGGVHCDLQVAGLGF